MEFVSGVICGEHFAMCTQRTKNRLRGLSPDPSSDNLSVPKGKLYVSSTSFMSLDLYPFKKCSICPARPPKLLYFRRRIREAFGFKDVLRSRASTILPAALQRHGRRSLPSQAALGFSVQSSRNTVNDPRIITTTAQFQISKNIFD